MIQIVRDAIAKALALLPLAAAAMTYPPYDLYPYLADSTDKDAAGNALQVWQDYVAGTDPTDVNDLFRATIDMSGGTPVVSWTPVLSAAEAAKRTYTVFGRKSLLSGDWTPVTSGQEANYNFFKVRVAMK